jgi:hypothetical protein
VRTACSLFGALVIAFAAVVALELAGIRSFGRDLADLARGVAAALALGALQGALWPWLWNRRDEAARSAGAGALVGGLSAFIVAGATSPWIALGPLGAGSLGEIPIVPLSISQLLAALAVSRPRRI